LEDVEVTVTSRSGKTWTTVVRRVVWAGASKFHRGETVALCETRSSRASSGRERDDVGDTADIQYERPDYSDYGWDDSTAIEQGNASWAGGDEDYLGRDDDYH